MGRDLSMKARPGVVGVFLGLSLFLACLSGCSLWQQGSEPEPEPISPDPPLEAKVRMEFLENREHRDSLIDVFVGIEVFHAVPGRSYHVSAAVEFAGAAGDKVFDKVHSAEDTVFHLSWFLTEEVKNLKGATLRGRFTIDSVEFGRDSVTYY
jgi:hypothetical protein